MPPYIPPNARPPPSTPPSSQSSSAAAGRGRGRGESSIRPDGLKMARKEIGKKPGEMEMLASPSRGIDGNDEVTLRNFQVQEKFRDHIQAKIVKLDAQYPSGRMGHWPKRKEELSIILLDFRKLREGLTSSKRMDSFAAEVYESAINYAIEAQNYQQLGASLPFLVFELHPFLASSPLATEDELATSVSQISLGPTSRPKYVLNEDKKALYQALYLIYLMVVLNEIPSFRRTLALFTSSANATATATTSTITPSYSPFISASSSLAPDSTLDSSSALQTSPPAPTVPPPPLHPHLLLAQSIFLSLLSTNYIKFSRLISPPSPPSSPSHSLPSSSSSLSLSTPYHPPPLLLPLLHSHLSTLREKTWQTLIKSYKMEKDFRDLDWLEKVLLFNLGGRGKGREELKEFLKGKGKEVKEESGWDLVIE